MDRQTTQKLAAMLRRTRRYAITESRPPGLLREFHQWADGRPCEGAFLMEGDDGMRTWLVLIDWKMNGTYYLVLFPENRIGPIYEMHRMQAASPDPTLEWTYIPKKRDGKNDQRRAYFLTTYGTRTATLVLPKALEEIDEFVDDLIELAVYRLKADTLAKVMPSSREWVLEGFPEGRRIFRLHSARERNPSLISEAKKRAIRRDGTLRCTCCGFDFGLAYGKVGIGYLEAHHTKPLSSLDDDGGITRIEDLSLVCANCHRMIHRRRPWLVAEDLTKIVQKVGGGETF